MPLQCSLLRSENGAINDVMTCPSQVRIFVGIGISMNRAPALSNEMTNIAHKAYLQN
jgi:hypothetical protein